jgi:hypothetical protein
LTSWGVSFWIDDALVVASELVTNSCSHGIPPVALSLALLPAHPRSGLQIEVGDASIQLPTERDPGHGGGFGMIVLRNYADITIHPHPHGKTIRAVLLPPTPAD